MVRRVFTKIAFAFGLFCFITPCAINAQQVTFSMSPSTVAPTAAVGDTVSLQVSVNNFTNIASFQYTIEWDPLLFSFISLDNINILDPSNFLANPYGGNTVLVGWNSSPTSRSLPNGQNIFRLRLKIKAASTNYWAKFSSATVPIEVIEAPYTVINPAFGNLGNPPGTTTTPVTVQATAAQTVQTQSKVCVNATANDFTNISSAQWVTKWNPSVLRFDSISVMNSTIGFTSTHFNSTQASGRLALNWSAPLGTTRTVSNGSTLYRVCYTAVGASGTSSTVSFDSAQIYQAVAGNSVRVNMSPVSGTVNINAGQQSTGLIFTASNHVVNQNDQVCVQIKAASFNRIAAITTAIFFDSSKMTLLRANVLPPSMGSSDSLLVAGGSSSNFNNNPAGTIRFVWIDPTALGLTLPDSTVLMELCFRYTGAAGTSSLIRFGAYGQKQVIKDGDLLTVPAIYRNGSVGVAASASVISTTSTLKHITCPTGRDGGVSLAVSGGTGTYSYIWSNSATTKDIANVPSGEYKVTITSGTQTKIETFTLTEPTAMSSVNTPVNVNCFGLSTGSISLDVTGGTSPYIYSWSNNAITKNLSNIPAGSYTVTVTDSRSCRYTPAAITVLQPTTPLSISSATKTNISCKSASDGAVNITVGGGTANYIYSWVGDGGYINNTQNISGIKAGIYNLTVTDAKGCNASRKDTISEPDSLLIGAATLRHTNCGSITGAITIAGVTGGNGTNTFAWTGPSYTANAQNIMNLVAGQYSLTVKDAKQCTATKSFTLTDSSSTIVLGNTTVNDIKCNGARDGSLIGAATGGTGPLSYKWTGPNGFNFTAQTIDRLNVGTYNLTVSDGSACSKTATYEIKEPAALALTPSVTHVKCKGESTGTIAISATGGTGTLSFAWTGSAATTQNAASLKAGNYSVTVSDANLCTKSQSFTITEPTDSLKILSANVAKISCSGTSTGAISVTVGGGTQPYVFAWTGPNNFSSTAQNISGVGVGTYRFLITDANNCTATLSYNVESNAPIAITANTSDATRSPNGTITLTATGGVAPYSYLWSGQGVSPTSKDQTGLCPGTYTVVVTDALNCKETKAISVGGECSTPMSFSVQTVAAGCPGQNLGKLDLTILGGAAPYTYTWTNASNTIVGRERVLSGLSAGVYTILVEDLIGQRKLETYTVVGSQTAVKITSLAVSPETCTGSDGSITLEATGGAPRYNYTWSDGVTSKDRPNMRAGVFSVTVADANGCLKDTNNIVIPRTPCPLVTITTKKDAKCFSEKTGSITVNIQNGEPGYTIRWSARDSIRINNQPSRNGTYEIKDLAAGLYNITITDARGQTRVESQTVGQPTQIRIERTVTPVTSGCNGSIILAVSGGEAPYTYSWNTGATSRDLFGLCCDTTKKYSVTLRDNAQCLASTGNDTVPCIIAAMTVDALISNPICKADSLSGRIELRINGGSTPFTYSWTNERNQPVGGNSPILSNVPPGKYFVSVTDNRQPNPQRFQGSYQLIVTSTLKLANLTVTAADDDLTANGKASIDIQGGSSDFNVVWCNGITSVATNTERTPSVSSLFSGNCSVTVTDRLGCREKIDFLIPSKSCATLDVLSQIKCFGEQNGSARIVKTSPDMTLPIQSYSWSSGETGPIAFKLKSGQNTVIITDAVAKKCTARVIMTEPAKLAVSINAQVRTKAADVEALITGGVTPYSIKWIPTSDTAQKTVITKSGTVYVFVSDRNGCPISAEKDIYIDVECLTGSVILSPNDDSRNESFSINGCDFKNIRLEVFNRWGQLVYSRDNYSNGVWQGHDQDGMAGKQLPDGVYLYILRSIDASNQPVLGKGTVTIVRQ